MNANEMKTFIRETKDMLRANSGVTEKILQTEGSAEYLAALYNGAIRGLTVKDLQLAFASDSPETVFSVITTVIDSRMADNDKMKEQVEKSTVMARGVEKDNNFVLERMADTLDAIQETNRKTNQEAKQETKQEMKGETKEKTHPEKEKKDLFVRIAEERLEEYRLIQERDREKIRNLEEELERRKAAEKEAVSDNKSGTVPGSGDANGVVEKKHSSFLERLLKPVSESDRQAEAAAQDRRDAVSAFVEEFITDNREYTEEAKDYFMKLIDSGSPISEVRFVARKNMSVENMEVLRRVYRERKK